jgi:hypothetical protein
MEWNTGAECFSKKMIRGLIPVAVAFVALLSAPFCHMLIHNADPRGERICCCSDAGQKNTLISCPGCGDALAADVLGRWSPEMVPGTIRPPFPLMMTRLPKDIFRMPATVFLDVPDKPPRQS